MTYLPVWGWGILQGNWNPQDSVENMYAAKQEEEFKYRELGTVDDFRCGKKMK